MSTALPGPLRSGDRVGIVAPSGPVDEARLDRGLLEVERLGLVPSAPASVRARDGLHAGPDAARAADLQAAFAAPGLRAVWAARGGHGLLPLLPRLDLGAMARADRLLIGYSDLTALALALSSGLAPFAWLHAPMVAELGAEPPTHDAPSLEAGLFGSHPGGRQEVGGLTSVQTGATRGLIVGGCLSLIVASLGTPWQPNLAGRILFFEEVGEEPYRLDRMLWQLRLAGCFAGLAGMVVGQLIDCESRGAAPGSTIPSAAEVVARHAAAVAGPVVMGLPAGHGPGRVSIPLGVPVELDARAGAVLFQHRP